MNKAKSIVPFYFDTEFTGFRPDTKLISIGMIIPMSDNLKNSMSFYAEDIDVEINDHEMPMETYGFLKSNVVPHLLYDKSVYGRLGYDEVDEDKNQVICLHGKDRISRQMMEWFNVAKERLTNDMVESEIVFIPISDVMSYDMVLLQSMISDRYHDINISPAGYDINNMIARYLYIKDHPFIDGASAFFNDYHLYADDYIMKAFDASREDLVKELSDRLDMENPFDIIGIQKHNALFDAKVIYMISKLLHYTFSGL